MCLLGIYLVHYHGSSLVLAVQINHQYYCPCSGPHRKFGLATKCIIICVKNYFVIVHLTAFYV